MAKPGPATLLTRAAWAGRYGQRAARFRGCARHGARRRRGGGVQPAQLGAAGQRRHAHAGLGGGHDRRGRGHARQGQALGAGPGGCGRHLLQDQGVRLPIAPAAGHAYADVGASVQAIGELVRLRPTCIRGNASEVMATAGAAVQTRGVDSSQGVAAAEASARQLARDADCVVAVSGAVDLVRCRLPSTQAFTCGQAETGRR